jgi:hypothetical protein
MFATWRRATVPREADSDGRVLAHGGPGPMSIVQRHRVGHGTATSGASVKFMARWKRKAHGSEVMLGLAGQPVFAGPEADRQRSGGGAWHCISTSRCWWLARCWRAVTWSRCSHRPAGPLRRTPVLCVIVGYLVVMCRCWGRLRQQIPDIGVIGYIISGSSATGWCARILEDRHGHHGLGHRPVDPGCRHGGGLLKPSIML